MNGRIKIRNYENKSVSIQGDVTGNIVTGDNNKINDGARKTDKTNGRYVVIASVITGILTIIGAVAAALIGQ